MKCLIKIFALSTPGGENPTGISAEYWSPNVGMVRRDYLDGYYKELIEYNVHPLI